MRELNVNEVEKVNGGDIIPNPIGGAPQFPIVILPHDLNDILK